ncbi:MAG: hypothetical protein L6R41_005339 [Letrouitia leprolyta]|nr:MAG: hypothetical protein L6R41_005339 [Letrouitia leprolyta]
MFSPARRNTQGSYTSKFQELLDDAEGRSSQPQDEFPALVNDRSPAKRLAPIIESLEAETSASMLENQAPATQRTPPTGPRSTYARIARGWRGQRDGGALTNEPHRLTGPTPQPLRGFPNFPQSNPPNRNLQLGSTRLQNTNKLGNGATWGLGAVNGAPGLPSAQGRQSGTTTNASFAQSIGGSQSATPLDLSEFPSLSGAPQTHYQNPGQAVWGNSNQRIIQHTPVQRPQQQAPAPPHNSVQQQSQQPSQNQEQPQQPREDIYSGSQLTGSSDDYHRGGQGGIGQLGASVQPQPSSIEEFPPLGRNGTDESQHDRRGSLMQSAAFGGFSNSSAFSLPPNQSQARHGLPSSQHNQSDSGRSSALDRITSPSSLSFASSSNRHGLSSAAEHDKNALPTPRANQLNNVNSILSNFQNHVIGSSPQTAHSQQPPSRQQQGYQVSGASQTAENTPLDQMAPIDRWGLAGLLATVRSDNPDVSGLAIGQDLTQLGLDLNSQDANLTPLPIHRPLWPTWSGPFASPAARPLQPDFHLPECYTVDNVHRVRDKISSFSDETLFWIFYTQPRDLMQELAATELTQRNWRYHKELMIYEFWRTGAVGGWDGEGELYFLQSEELAKSEE